MIYEMTPEEQELNDTHNESPEELAAKVERAILAEHLVIITAKGSPQSAYIILLSRVGEADTKMLLSVAQARSCAEEIARACDDIEASLVRRMILDG